MQSEEDDVTRTWRRVRDRLLAAGHEFDLPSPTERDAAAPTRPRELCRYENEWLTRLYALSDKAYYQPDEKARLYHNLDTVAFKACSGAEPTFSPTFVELQREIIDQDLSIEEGRRKREEWITNISEFIQRKRAQKQAK